MNESLNEDNAGAYDSNHFHQVLNQTDQYNQQQKAKLQQVLEGHNAALTGYQRRQDVWTKQLQRNVGQEEQELDALLAADAEKEKQKEDLVRAVRLFLSRKFQGENAAPTDNISRAINICAGACRVGVSEVINFIAEGLVKGYVVKGVDDTHLKHVITAESIKPYIMQMKENNTQRMRITKQALAQILEEEDPTKQQTIRELANKMILEVQKTLPPKTSPVVQQPFQQAPDIHPNVQHPAQDGITEIKISNIKTYINGNISSFNLNFESGQPKQLAFKDVAAFGSDFKLQNTNGRESKQLKKSSLEYVGIHLTPESTNAIKTFIQKKRGSKKDNEITIKAEDIGGFTSQLHFRQQAAGENPQKRSLAQLLHASEMRNGDLYVDAKKIQEEITEVIPPEIVPEVNLMQEDEEKKKVQDNQGGYVLSKIDLSALEEEIANYDDVVINFAEDASRQSIEEEDKHSQYHGNNHSQNFDDDSAEYGEQVDINRPLSRLEGGSRRHSLSSINEKEEASRNHFLPSSQLEGGMMLSLPHRGSHSRPDVYLEGKYNLVIPRTTRQKNQDLLTSTQNTLRRNNLLVEIQEESGTQKAANNSTSQAKPQLEVPEAIKKALRKVAQKYNLSDDKHLIPSWVASLAGKKGYFTKGTPKMPVEDKGLLSFLSSDVTMNDKFSRAMRRFSYEFQKECRDGELHYTSQNDNVGKKVMSFFGSAEKKNLNGMRTKSILAFLGKQNLGNLTPLQYIASLIGEVQREKEPKIDFNDFYRHQALHSLSNLSNNEDSEAQQIDKKPLNRSPNKKGSSISFS